MFKLGKLIRSALQLIALLALFLSLSGCNSNQSNAPGSLNQSKWSDTSPSINLEHVFHGEINKRGKPTGFHSRPGGKAPETARIARVMSKANKAGVYTARIEVYDPSRDQWREKFSSMFPDELSQAEVIKAISHAYKNRNKSKEQPWSGPSGLGFQIQGYVLRDGRINTAFPVYRKN